MKQNRRIYRYHRHYHYTHNVIAQLYHRHGLYVTVAIAFLIGLVLTKLLKVVMPIVKGLASLGFLFLTVYFVVVVVYLVMYHSRKYADSRACYTFGFLALPYLSKFISLGTFWGPTAALVVIIIVRRIMEALA